VKANLWGIEVNSGPYNTTILENNIINNHRLGIQIVHSYKTEIIRNNFINNTENAYFYNIRFPQFVIMKNSWENNYWGEPKKLPTVIHGSYYSLLSLFIELPWIALDWRPAQEPYDIPGMT
jgi:parallel beta-helix repeat protein